MTAQLERNAVQILTTGLGYWKLHGWVSVAVHLDEYIVLPSWVNIPKRVLH